MSRAAHPLCRPEVGARAIASEFDESTKLWRLDEKTGRFKADDAAPGLAFIGVLEGSPTIWVAHCACKIHLDCPVAKAMTFAVDKLDVQAVSIARVTRAKGRPPAARGRVRDQAPRRKTRRA